MFMNPAKMNFILMMVMGVVLSVSANSWFMVWLGMEMNLIGFIPLMIMNNNKSSNESSIKYFLVQAISSSILILMSLKMNINLLSKSMAITMALMIKMGAAPFHFWIPSIIESLEWMMGFMMLTWQKITPLIMLTYLQTNMNMYIILSLILGSVGGLMQTSIKKIISFSSISHLGWLITASSISITTMKIYFMVYMMTLMMIMNISAKLNFTLINNALFMNKKEKILIFIFMLSLMGMPPLMGFFPKLLIITMTMNNSMILITVIMIASSTINLYFYLRMAYYTLTVNNSNKKIFYKNNKLLITLEPLLIILSPIIPAMNFL